jgi:hypothetical protein
MINLLETNLNCDRDILAALLQEKMLNFDNLYIIYDFNKLLTSVNQVHLTASSSGACNYALSFQFYIHSFLCY